MELFCSGKTNMYRYQWVGTKKSAHTPVYPSILWNTYRHIGLSLVLRCRTFIYVKKIPHFFWKIVHFSPLTDSFRRLVNYTKIFWSIMEVIIGCSPDQIRNQIIVSSFSVCQVYTMLLFWSEAFTIMYDCIHTIEKCTPKAKWVWQMWFSSVAKIIQNTSRLSAFSGFSFLFFFTKCPNAGQKWH